MIVFSIALCKHRLHNVKPIVNNLLSGTLKPDKIHFFISKEPFFYDEGIQPSELPKIKSKKVEFNYVENTGIMRRLIPIVKKYWEKPNTKIIIFDDDRKPSKTMVEKIVQLSNEYPNKCLTYGGFNIPYFQALNEFTINKLHKVDVVVPCLGTLVKPKFFKKEDIWNWKQHQTDNIDTRYSNEVYISYCLARKGIEKYFVEGETATQLNEGGEKITGGSQYKTGLNTKQSKLHQIREWKSIFKGKPRKVIIDCGCYNGDSIDKLIKKNNDTNKYALVIYGFEPVPHLANKASKSHSYATIIQKAVWYEKCQKRFYLGRNEGSSLYNSKVTNGVGNNGFITVDCIDLSQWIRKRFKKEDYIILKLDIEGAEYPILEHMLRNGTYEYINELYCEWHWKKVKSLNKNRHKKLKKRVSDKLRWWK